MLLHFNIFVCQMDFPGHRRTAFISGHVNCTRSVFFLNHREKLGHLIRKPLTRQQIESERKNLFVLEYFNCGYR